MSLHAGYHNSYMAKESSDNYAESLGINFAVSLAMQRKQWQIVNYTESYFAISLAMHVIMNA